MCVRTQLLQRDKKRERKREIMRETERERKRKKYGLCVCLCVCLVTGWVQSAMCMCDGVFRQHASAESHQYSSLGERAARAPAIRVYEMRESLVSYLSAHTTSVEVLDTPCDCRRDTPF